MVHTLAASASPVGNLEYGGIHHLLLLNVPVCAQSRWPRSLPAATPVCLPVSSCHVAADAALLSLVLRNPAG